jgi:hypothetical protein
MFLKRYRTLWLEEFTRENAGDIRLERKIENIIREPLSANVRSLTFIKKA